jgi:hypothetical protein
MKIQMFQVVARSKGFRTHYKIGNVLLIYVLPTTNVESRQHEILSQYKEYKDMFEKKNVDSL